MKRLLFAGAAAASLIASPAIAQQVSSPPAETPTTTVHTEEPVESAPTGQEWVAQSNSGGAVEAPAQSAETAQSGDLTVQGVTPSEALGAIDPTKLTDEAESASPDQTATAEPADAESAVTVAEAEPMPSDEALAGEGAEPTLSAEAPADAGAGATELAEADPEVMPSGEHELVQVADVSVALPQKVADVVEDGSYSTDDLVAAQLAAIQEDSAVPAG